MKKIKVLILALLVLGSCKNMDFGDINQDPIGPNKPEPNGLLAGAILNFFNNSGRSYLTNPTFYIQWQAQNIYTSEMQYADQPISWNPWYVQVLSNLKKHNDYIEEHRAEYEANSEWDPGNQIGAGKIMMAYIFKFVTDIYGDIPFSEALDPNNKTPKYDNQIQIYHSIIDMLKDARDNMDPANPGPHGDIIFNGDVSKWQKLANSLILHAALQLSNVSSEVAYAQAEFNSALSHPAGVIENLDDEPWIKFNDYSSSYQNPFSRLRRSDYLLTQEFTDALKGNAHGLGSCSPSYNHTADLREYIFSNDPLDSGKAYSCTAGGSGSAQMSDLIWDPKAPLPFYTAAWTYLDRAEAAARGWTSESFDDMLTNAIEKSYESLSIHYLPNYFSTFQSAGASFAAARVADANDANYGAAGGDATKAKLEVVAEEKWVAYFPMGFEGWTQWRRLSDYLVLTPHPQPLNATGQIPRRYAYPQNESTFNPTNYSQAVQDLSPAEDRNDSRVPWDQ